MRSRWSALVLRHVLQPAGDGRGGRAALTARARDTDGITWSATAQFQATSAGEVSLGQPSLGGSCTGVNPMGLFTLMAPPPGSAPDWFLCTCPSTPRAGVPRCWSSAAPAGA